MIVPPLRKLTEMRCAALVLRLRGRIGISQYCRATRRGRKVVVAHNDRMGLEGAPFIVFVGMRCFFRYAFARCSVFVA